MIFLLDELPEEILLRIIFQLDYSSLEIALTNLPRVCRNWNKAFSSDKRCVWTGLAHRFGVRVGKRQLSKSGSRHGLKHSVWKRKQELDAAKRVQHDAMVWEIWKKLRASDCVAWTRKRLLKRNNKNNSEPIGVRVLVDHRVRSLEHRTVLHLACWCGRNRTVGMLLDEFAADIFVRDDLDATPLLIAAWAGHASVVRLLLKRLRLPPPQTTTTLTTTTTTTIELTRTQQQLLFSYLNQKGAPPLTSSCGGRGSKTALCWAKRKEHWEVVRLLEQAVQ